jgi:hypothetical protein
MVVGGGKEALRGISASLRGEFAAFIFDFAALSGVLTLISGVCFLLRGGIESPCGGLDRIRGGTIDLDRLLCSTECMYASREGASEWNSTTSFRVRIRGGGTGLSVRRENIPFGVISSRGF